MATNTNSNNDSNNDNINDIEAPSETTPLVSKAGESKDEPKPLQDMKAESIKERLVAVAAVATGTCRNPTNQPCGIDSTLLPLNGLNLTGMDST